jgi:protocatechuate 3,4-dioxygenase beta subunit
MRRLLPLPLALLFVTPLVAQDTEFIRALESAQRLRPAQLTSTARIAPIGEPGTALVIHGRVFKDDGQTPLAGAVVFAYHTDRHGLYDEPGTVHSWRLKGWAKTDADGRFQFSTIRPGPYPGERIAAHVHFTLMPAEGGRFHAGELLFAGDPALTPRQKDHSASAGTFAEIRPVRRDGGAEHVEINLKVNPTDKF